MAIHGIKKDAPLLVHIALRHLRWRLLDLFFADLAEREAREQLALARRRLICIVEARTSTETSLSGMAVP